MVELVAHKITEATKVPQNLINVLSSIAKLLPVCSENRFSCLGL